MIRAESFGRNAREFARARESARRLGAETGQSRFRLGVAGARALSPFYTLAVLACPVDTSLGVNIDRSAIVLDIMYNHADVREIIACSLPISR